MNITYNVRPVISSELIRLYLDAGWGVDSDYKDQEFRYQNALNNSKIITAFDGDKLIGFIRFLTDGFQDTQILEFIVDKNYQKQGIGTKLLDILKEEFGNTSIYINSTAIACDFLEHNSFKKHKLVGMSCRK